MSQKVTHLRPSGQITPFTPSLSLAFRLLEDINLQHAQLIATHSGGDVDRIIESGYGRMTAACLRELGSVPGFLKTGLIVLPCRDVQGGIVALHDYQGRWITTPAVHIANPVRARWTEVQVCETTSEADSLALSENICAIGRNGCDKKTVAAAFLSARRYEWSLEGRLAA